VPNSEANIVVIERLTRVEEKLDNALTYMLDNRNRIDGHEPRIRALETSGAKLFGMGAVVSLLAGVAGSQVFEKLLG
jgi:hypothetical protein